MMPPPRYQQQSMNGPYHIQQNHLQSHNPSQQHGLPPPTHLATPSFGAGGSSSTSPFAMAGHLNNAFDRDMPGGMLPGQISQMGFARGAPVQAHQNYDGLPISREGKEESRIRNVWKHNLVQEMAALRQLVETYIYCNGYRISWHSGQAHWSIHHQSRLSLPNPKMQCGLIKMIQLGITLFKPDGSLPPPDLIVPTKAQFPPNFVAACTWQFNFRFSLESDMYAQESTTMLSKAGIEFERHAKQGIDPDVFGALLISSGLVLDPDVHWISFHSGYDFGYLMKIMICKPLPDDETEFHKYLEKFFPSLFDIKFMLKHAGLKGSVNNNQPLTPEAQMTVSKIMTKPGLQDVAEELAVTRIGQAHQAGSDSLITGQVYFKMKEKIFNGTIDEERYRGQVWGLNAQMPTTGPNHRDLNTPNMNGATFYNQNGGPSTPQTGNAGMALGGAGQSLTPAPSQSSHGVLGTITPGGFGNFQYGKVIS